MIKCTQSSWGVHESNLRQLPKKDIPQICIYL